MVENKKKVNWDDACLPIGLNNYAKEFLDTAIYLAKNPKYSFKSPTYYLASHAIELSLKAYLMANDISLQQLKSEYGHDLAKLYEKSKEFGFNRQMEQLGSDPESFAHVIDLINPYYCSKEFEYIKTGFQTLPTIEILIKSAKALIKTVHSLCEADRKSRKV